MQTVIKIVFLILLGTSLQAQELDTSTINWKALKIENKSFKTNYYEGDRTISRRGFQDIIKDDTDAFKSYKKGKTLGIVSNVIGIPAAAVFGFSFGSLITGGEVGGNETVLVVSGAVTVCTFILNMISESKIKKAIEGYNSRNTSVGLNINQEGIGLALNF